jgi:SAM-dependent methyltransferase
MAMARDAGWYVEGCEPNRWMCQWANDHYGLNVVPGTVFDMNLKSESLDLVSLWDVLEHTPDPKSTLEECHRVLKPGGVLLVNYPDINSLVAQLMGRRWVFLLSVHLYYFTNRTLSRMLKELGFRPLEVKRHWQSLELGYILFRMEAYNRPVAKALGWLVKSLRLSHLQIPYWMGQMLVIAERI